MCFNLYMHLIMHFCDKVLSQISTLQTLTCMVNLMYIQPHCEFMHVKLEWSGFHCFPFIVMFASFIPIILYIISLIYFDIHAFISKPIYHLNLKDETLQEFNAMQNERSGLLKEENHEVILMSEKHI